MDWENIEKQEGNAYLVPETWIYIHYYEALNVLFRIENALRLFVFVILKNEKQDDWINIHINSEEEAQKTISVIAKKRISQAKNFGYLSFPISCPIMHLTTGEIIQLIDTQWNYFRDYFPASKDITKNKLEEISTVRNAIAHFRPIRPDDVSVIKQNANHVLSKIELCIADLTRLSKIVPTNTEETWYRDLKVMGTDYCSLSFLQSDREIWIKVKIKYLSAIIDKQRWSEGVVNYQVLRLKSSSILREYPNIKKYVTYVSEEIPYINMNEETEPEFHKKCKFSI